MGLKKEPLSSISYQNSDTEHCHLKMYACVYPDPATHDKLTTAGYGDLCASFELWRNAEEVHRSLSLIIFSDRYLLALWKVSEPNSPLFPSLSFMLMMGWLKWIHPVIKAHRVIITIENTSGYYISCPADRYSYG